MVFVKERRRGPLLLYNCALSSMIGMWVVWGICLIGQKASEHMNELKDMSRQVWS